MQVASDVAGGLTPLSLQLRGASGGLVGRAVELNALRTELAAAGRGQLAAVALEGEPGIGKTRLLVAADELARVQGFITVSTAADEEFRGPFLLARAMLSAAAQAAEGLTAAAPAVEPALAHLRRVGDALSGRDDPSTAGLSPEAKQLRVLDLGAVALQALAASRPLALLIDDLHWADGDSVRMLRYLVRSVVGVPLFLGVALRREEAAGTEAASLLADMERMGLLRRLLIDRMTQVESAELLRSILGGEVDPRSVATIHAQAEGVPFILQEVARAYRDAGMVQQIDGSWTLARNAERLVPSAVRTLISRRAARLPEDARTILAEAAVVGRSFALAELLAARRHLGDSEPSDTTELAHLLEPAVTAGLLVELPATAPADYRFAHDQVQGLVAGWLTMPRRRAIHGALVDLLADEAEPAPGTLAMLARHALESGDAERAGRYTLEAAAAALATRAPEEALRLVDLALPVVMRPQDRVGLLTARDDALEMLRRPVDRMEALAELSALAAALADPQLEQDILLRRCAALRMSDEDERAVQVATQVREAAAARGDRSTELRACMELGQAFIHRPVGESFSPSVREADLDRAEEAYTCVCTLAGGLGDRAALAAATRELGVIAAGRVRGWYVDYIETHDMSGLLARLAAGEALDDIIAELPIAPVIERATHLLEQAVELFEQLGDRRGMMSSIIAMAYLRFGPEVHFQASARRIEEIRHLATQMLTLTRESERELAQAQMLYGVHVFARAKVVPDLALSRGAEAHERAHLLGERTLEFLAAGGVAMVHRELGNPSESNRWLAAATAAATAAPTPFKARQLALWRGSCYAAVGDAVGMRRELEHAVDLAAAQRRPAASCEALAQLALEAAWLGERSGDQSLLALAEDRAHQARALAASLPGKPLWGAHADAALVRTCLARGDVEAAVKAARRALRALAEADLEDLQAEVLLPAGRALLQGGNDAERQLVLERLRTGVALIAQRIEDESIRAHWFTGPLGRELLELAGALQPGQPAGNGAAAQPGLDAQDVELLRMLVEGRTNAEMAELLGIDAPALARRLAELYSRTGGYSRAQATTFALRERVF